MSSVDQKRDMSSGSGSGSGSSSLKKPDVLLSSGTSSDSLQNAEKPTRFALLIGCQYERQPIIRTLRGCFSDVELMSYFLESRFGFTRENIKVMKDEEDEGHSLYPSRENILNAFQEIIDKTSPGGIVFFYFAGHGENTYKDEQGNDAHTFVPANINPLAGVDLYYRIRDKPLKFTLMVDCCHSGGIIRNVIAVDSPFEESSSSSVVSTELTPRKVSYLDLLNFFRDQTGSDNPDIKEHLVRLYGRDHISLVYQQPRWNPPPTPGPNVRCIIMTACRDYEFANEALMPNGKFHGVYTWAFGQTINILHRPNLSSSNENLNILHRQNLSSSNENLNLQVTYFIKGLGYREQHPQLYFPEVSYPNNKFIEFGDMMRDY